MTGARPSIRVLRVVGSALLLVLAPGASCGVAHEAVAAPDSASWAVAPEPLWRIGDASGPAPYLLDRVFSGLITGHGAALIGNSGTREIRRFDSAGAFVSATGRQGAGPGEFRSINWMSRFRGDSILVFDLRSQRFSVITPRGTFVRSFQNGGFGGPAFPRGVFPDGAVLIGVEKAYDPRAGAGRVRDTLALHRVAGDSAAAVLRLPGAEWLVYGDGMRYRSTRLPFGRTALVAVSGDRIVHGSSDSPRLHVLDGSGRELATIDLPLRARSLAREEVRDAVEEAVANAGDRALVRRELSHRGGITAPVMTDLRADSEGNVWVRAYPPAGGGSAEWIVVSPDGALVGSRLLPVGWHPLDLRGGLMLVRERDADGVERVSLRQVTR